MGLEKSLPQGDSGPDGVLLRSWFVHINSRIVGRPTAELDSFSAQLQKAGTLVVIPMSQLFWEGCYLFQGVSSSTRDLHDGEVAIVRARPAVRIECVLAAARLTSGSSNALLRGPMGEGQYHREGGNTSDGLHLYLSTDGRVLCSPFFRRRGAISLME